MCTSTFKSSSDLYWHLHISKLEFFKLIYIYMYINLKNYIYICDDFFFLLHSLVFVSARMAAYPFMSIESSCYFAFDICLEMAAVASAVNCRVADSIRLALQPYRFRFDIDRRASIDSFSRFFSSRTYNNRIRDYVKFIGWKKITGEDY